VSVGLTRRVERLERVAHPLARLEPGPHPLCPRCGRCGGICLPTVAAVSVFPDCAAPGDMLCGCGADCPTCGGAKSPMRLLEEWRADGTLG
jgi:hypothetical protein